MPTGLDAFRTMKQTKQPICMLTCYSFPTAQQLSLAGVDILLVGDSLGTTFLGYDSTNKVTMDDMCYHTAAVRRGAADACILADLPFNTYLDPDMAVANAQRLCESGANAVKLEGALTEVIEAISAAGVEVCGHVGYLPQTAKKPGVVGKEKESAQQLIDDACAIEAAGAKMIVLELVPKQLSQHISQILQIPTIGIGAGLHCDGQVQVLDDLLGISERVFKHAEHFADHRKQALAGIQRYCEEVRQGIFPADKHVSHVDDSLIDELK